MPNFEIDREMLESFSSSEIKRILREDYEDYTPEAIEIFKDILEARGDDDQAVFSASTPTGISGEASQKYAAGSLPINSPRDAINFLNGLLSGVMNDRIDLVKAGVSVNIVMAILKAHESALLTESDEG